MTSEDKTARFPMQRQIISELLLGGKNSEQPGVQLHEYWRVLKKHRFVILLMVALGLMIGVWVAITRVPIYQAKATLVIEPEQANLTSVEGAVIFAGPSWRFYETQYQLLRSRLVAQRAAQKLPDKSDPPSTTDGPQFGPGQWWAEIKALLSLRPANSAQDKTRTLANEVTRHRLTHTVQQGIGVQGDDNSELVVVSYDSPNPEFAADVANAVVDAYIELGLESRLDKVKRASSWLTERIEDLRQKVVESEATLQAFQDKEGMIDLKSREELTSSKLSILNQEYVAAQRRYSELAKRYGPKHPKIIASKAELNAAQKRLDSESRQVVNTQKKEFELAKLEREVATNRQLYEMFLTRFKETDISTDYTLSNARVVDRAQIPTTPYKPDKAAIVGIWFIIGSILGIVIAFLREYLDNTFSSTDKVEEKLRLPVLGVVPLLKLKAKPQKHEPVTDLGIPERYYIFKSQSSFAEAINHIRTGTTYSNVDAPPRVIVITSAVQGEGKTTLATNLALSYAQLGRTLLIDADLRKPRVAHITGVQQGAGLVEYVAGDEKL
ncbi:MAG: exopolysaccharide transport family protein, partial [Gammaproteobacteria bacterium]|nr:exopolysaccharide transport family protein [Gammaproteobacteria bacterium]